MTRKPLAVQIYTLRNDLANDVPGTLQAVADIGYNGVELWFAKWPPADELKAILDDTGLQPAGAHVSFLELRDNLDAVIAYHRAVGNADLAIPFLSEDLRGTSEAWHERVVEFAQIGARCRDAGMRLSYHNHAMEFQEFVDGVEAHDFIFSQVDSNVLKAQLDTYFITSVGKDPVAYLERYSGRVPLLHVKELGTVDGRQDTVEVGRGVLNWPAILEAAESAGVEWYIVEQDRQTRPALESIAMSYEYLRGLGLG
jgi:sugar phosphate isomerase/epimerase